MSNFKLIRGSCAVQTKDAVVNVANSRLLEGGGICGVIFNKCGSKELAQAFSKIQTPVKDGIAVITPAFNMNVMQSTLFMQFVKISDKLQKPFLNCKMSA